MHGETVGGECGKRGLADLHGWVWMIIHGYILLDAGSVGRVGRSGSGVPCLSLAHLGSLGHPQHPRGTHTHTHTHIHKAGVAG